MDTLQLTGRRGREGEGGGEGERKGERGKNGERQREREREREREGERREVSNNMTLTVPSSPNLGLPSFRGHANTRHASLREAIVLPW